ncbi:GNAT family N-acetyltransferase [Modestobacter sp. SYSU DS0875]
MEDEVSAAGGRAGLRVRVAGDRDAAAMHQLTRAAYQPYVPRIGREPAPMLADYGHLTPPACAWVLEQDARTVAVLVGEVATDHLLIENIAVDAARRGEGLGSLLLGLAEQHARALGLAQVRLYTNVAMTENVAYYARRGYRETHRAGQGGYRRVFFTKTLAPAPED